MNYKWKIEEDLFLRKYYPENGYEYCAEALNKDLTKLKARVKKMKLKRKGFKGAVENEFFILTNYKILSITEICSICKLTKNQVYRFLSSKGIRLANYGPYSSEEIDYLKDNYTCMSYEELGKQINRTGESIHAKLQHLKLKRTLKQRDRIMRKSSAYTQFKKGRLPHNTKTDGQISVRTCRGKKHKFIRISMNKWIPLQIFNWELVNGPIPDGNALRCIDGDVLNCDPENWMIIDRIDHLDLNLGRSALKDNYITMILTPKSKALRPTIAEMPELIELKRNQIKLRRTINELNETSKNDR